MIKFDDHPMMGHVFFLYGSMWKIVVPANSCDFVSRLCAVAKSVAYYSAPYILL